MRTLQLKPRCAAPAPDQDWALHASGSLCVGPACVASLHAFPSISCHLQRPPGCMCPLVKGVRAEQTGRVSCLLPASASPGGKGWLGGRGAARRGSLSSLTRCQPCGCGLACGCKCVFLCWREGASRDRTRPRRGLSLRRDNTAPSPPTPCSEGGTWQGHFYSVLPGPSRWPSDRQCEALCAVGHLRLGAEARSSIWVIGHWQGRRVAWGCSPQWWLCGQWR